MPLQLPCYTFHAMALALIFGFGLQELGVILAIVLVIFGAKQLPLIMRGLGQGIKEFKTAVKDDEEPSVSSELPSKDSNGNSD